MMPIANYLDLKLKHLNLEKLIIIRSKKAYMCQNVDDLKLQFVYEGHFLKHLTLLLLVILELTP